VNAEKYSGSLDVGKKADFIVLDRNILDIKLQSGMVEQ